MNGLLEIIVRSAARIMLDHENAAIHKKDGHYNFVTDADFMVQEFLREKLGALLPGSVFFSEEQENSELTDAPTWMVDPIDGTFNFMRRRRYSAISVALMQMKKPVLGMVFNPYANELFRAEINAGACLNGHPIHCSQTAFEDALVNFGTTPYRPELADAGIRAARAFLTEAGDLRRIGSAALELTEVSAGRTDIFYEMVLSPWDFAAGALIAREAGAVVIDPLRDELDFGRPACILACNPLCIDRARNIIRNAKQESAAQ